MPVDSDSYDDAIYIVNATPLPGKRLLCKYSDGKWNLFDVRPLLGNDVFSPLESDDIFYNIDISKGVPSWDDERIDIAPEHLYQNGIPLDDRDAWFLEFVSSLDDSGKDVAKRDLLSAVIDGFVEYISI